MSGRGAVRAGHPPPGRAAPGRAAPASPAPASPARRRNKDPIADADAEVEAAEGGTAVCREAALVLAATAASLRQEAPSSIPNKTLPEVGNSAAADDHASEPSERVEKIADTKALEEAERKAADAVKEKEQIRAELEKMKARLKAAEQGAGGRQTPTKPERDTKR